MKLSVPLFYLSIFTILVMVFFALVGMHVFSGNLHGGCYTYYRTPAGEHLCHLIINTVDFTIILVAYGPVISGCNREVTAL